MTRLRLLTLNSCQHHGLTLNSSRSVRGVSSGWMGIKAQHSDAYQHLPRFLAELREGANSTHRDLGKKLGKPQSWIHNCESANRRVDVTEFIAWAIACGLDP